MPGKRKTPAEQALCTAMTILREHYPAFVVIVPPEREEDDGPPIIVHRGHRTFWRGLLTDAYEALDIGDLEAEAESDAEDDDE